MGGGPFGWGTEIAIDESWSVQHWEGQWKPIYCLEHSIQNRPWNPRMPRCNKILFSICENTTLFCFLLIEQCLKLTNKTPTSFVPPILHFFSRSYRLCPARQLPIFDQTVRNYRLKIEFLSAWVMTNFHHGKKREKSLIFFQQKATVIALTAMCLKRQIISGEKLPLLAASFFSIFSNASSIAALPRRY